MNPAKSIGVALAAAAAALSIALTIASPARAESPTRDDIGSIP
jgi:hypothetical protein